MSSEVVTALITGVISLLAVSFSRWRSADQRRSDAMKVARDTNDLVRDSYADLLARQESATAAAEEELRQLRAEISDLRSELATLRAELDAERDTRERAERRFDQILRWSEKAISWMREHDIEPPAFPKIEGRD